MMQDDEKWSSVIREGENTAKNVSPASMMIKLKQITINDYPEQPIKLIPRKTKSDVYFVKDQNTTLSDEDMHYQIINVSLTTEKRPSLPELLKEDSKLPENFAKLFKLPGRPLPPKLVKLFDKNLIKPESFPDFSIDYEEITDNVKHVREVRQLRKLQCLYGSKSRTIFGKSLKIKHNQRQQPSPPDSVEEIFHHLPNQDHDYENRHNFQDNNNNNNNNNNANHENKSAKNILNDDSSHSLLKKIDVDFKPTILLGTKTYSRKRKMKVE